MAEQLDLLAWRAPCQVYLFPASRLIGQARRLAAMAARKDAATMRKVWSLTAAEMDLQMTDAGASTEQREAEIRAFSSLVQQEVQSLLDQSYRGGAA